MGDCGYNSTYTLFLGHLPKSAKSQGRTRPAAVSPQETELGAHPDLRIKTNTKYENSNAFFKKHIFAIHLKFRGCKWVDLT